MVLTPPVFHQRVTPKIFREEMGAAEEKGEHARLSSFIGSIAVADLIKSTLGPKGRKSSSINNLYKFINLYIYIGMDKILVSAPGEHPGAGSVTVTNDGATILKALPVDNAAAKILVDISKTQDANGAAGLVADALCGF